MRWFHKAAATLVMASTAWAPAFAQVQPLEGLLEVGPQRSVLLVLSAESGDLVGYVFRNESAAGRVILEQCVPQMFCRVARAEVGSAAAPFGLLRGPDRPSGWLELNAAREVSLVSGVAPASSASSERYGALAVTGRALTLNGQALQPPVEGSSGLAMAGTFPARGYEAVLLQEAGDAACPVRFRFVAIDGRRARASRAFGTCSDIVRVEQDEDGTVVVHMVGPALPAPAGEARSKNARARITYRYRAGQLTESSWPAR